MGAPYYGLMRIISVGTLKAFWEAPEQRGAEQPLRTWIRVVRAASWADLTAIKRTFNSADILEDGQVMFDIGGNKYRLITWINFHYGVVYVRFIGAHRDFDRVDARTV
jgi:mRNA interferase HigB